MAVTTVVLQEEEHAHLFIDEVETFNRLIKHQIENNAKAMATFSDNLGQNPELKAALKRGNRDELHKLTLPFYENMERDFGVSHLYFNAPDRKNILRLHQPQRHGDVIERQTSLSAEYTGERTSGIEIGPLGTTTLRVVTPWLINKELIGYLEIGKEIKHLIDSSNVLNEMIIQVFLSKAKIDQAGWRQGIEMLGRKAGWDDFPAHVLVGSSNGDLPAGLSGDKIAAILDPPEKGEFTVFESDQSVIRLGAIPLFDFGGQSVGTIVFVLDDQVHAQTLNTTLFRIHLLYGGIALAVLFFFWIYLGRVDRTTDERERRLKKSREEQMQSLEESERLIKGILNSISDIFFSVDREWRLQYVNPQMEKLFQVKSQDILAQDLWEVFPEMASFFYRPLKKAMRQGGEAIFDAFYSPLNSWLQVRGFPSETGMSIYLLDITARKEAEKELIEHREHLEQLVEKRTEEIKSTNSRLENEVIERKEAEVQFKAARIEAENANHAKSQFLSNMSHDLRTPMNAILGFAQIMQIDPDSPLTSDQEEAVRQIIKAGNHLLALINEVLDLSKIESGDVALSMDIVNTGDILDECLDLSKPLADARNITIEDNTGGTGALPNIIADHTRLKQVLLNILSNAVKYNREGGRIFLNILDSALGSLRINITDTGPGLSDDDIARVFNPFDRLGAENSEVEGTGIGMTITRRLVEKMNGSIGVESVLGEGATFWVEFQTWGDVDNEVPEPAALLEMAELENMNSSAAISNVGGVTILYVEDNPANVALMERVITHLGACELICILNAESAVELAVSRQPDLILMDINLPGMNGFEALEKLRAREETKDIPVIALSANAMQRDIEKGRQAGFNDYIIKPIHIPTLTKILDDLILGASK
ncbi:MAG: response regulator [Rhodospirillaceae bacterium]|nr:response regulator [Rhodospirillaceae bacterium]